GNHSSGGSFPAGGIAAVGSAVDDSANVIIDNSIVANNTSSGPARDCANGHLSSITAHYSLIEDPSSCAISGNNNITLQDPDLGAFTGVYFPLNEDSPAIDAGSDALAVNVDGSPLATDIAGNLRI